MSLSRASAGDDLYGDPQFAQFYDLDNDWGEDLAYCTRLARNARSVLDLGCGTGRLAAALAEGRDVAGVDPAGPMLDIARRRPGGEQVEWIEADARGLSLDRRFDLVVLTGHAFQVFLSRSDQAAVLRSIARHLAPGGRFIFDTRNPARAEWREWTPAISERFLQHPELGLVRAWNDVAHDEATGIVTYQTHYELADGSRRLSAESRIAFTARGDLAGLLDGAGLQVEEWLGDWLGREYGPDSPEIIPIGRRAKETPAGQAPD